MQNLSQDFKQEVWQKLFAVFNRYTSGQHQEITLEQLKHLIKEVLHEDGDSEVAYVIRHMAQIDSNHNGSIEFDEFANYLLKRHCGEMALQNMHKYKLATPLSDMKLTKQELYTLLNDAFSFIKLEVPRDLSDRMFDQLDSNKDGLVSYVEYYRFVEAFICETQLSPSQNNRQRMSPVKVRRPAEEVSEVLIRFRRLLWGQLFRIYIRYDSDGNGHMDDGEMTRLLKELLNETTKSELDYVFKNAFRMDLNGDKCFVFEEFSHFFIKHSCEVGLNRFNRSRPTGGRRDIADEDFLRLFRSCFCYLEQYIMTDELVRRVFEKIDKDRDGVISYKEYLQWTNELLAYREPCGMPCFLSEPKIQEIIFYTPIKSKNGEESPRSSSRRKHQEQQRQKRKKYMQERDRRERERFERERHQLERYDREKHQKINKEKDEMIRLQRERDERERRDIERFQRQQAERAKQERLQLQRERQQREKLEKMRQMREREQHERHQRERIYRERIQRQQTERDRIERERREEELLNRQRHEWQRSERLRQEQENLERDRMERERRGRLPQSKPPLYGRSNNSSVASSADKSVSFRIPESDSKYEKVQAAHDDEARSHRDRPRSAIKGFDIHGGNSYDVTPRVIVFSSSQKEDTQSVKSSSKVPRLNLSRATFLEVGSAKGSQSSIKSYSYRNLAEKIRQHTLRLLRTFDNNHNEVLDHEEILQILNHLLRENELQVKYVTRNFLRYKQTHTELVRFELFVNFFLGLHCGEMAVQRFHVKNMYSCGKDRIMNEKEFIMSFQGALDYVEFLAPMGQLKRLFREIDEDRDGWISYKEYFEFLKHFFSYLPKSTVDVLNKYPSLSGTPAQSPRYSEVSELDDHSLEDTLGILIRNQTTALLHHYCPGHNAPIARTLLPRIFKEAFGMEQAELEYCLLSFSRYDMDRDGALTVDELANLVLEIYCAEVVLQRLNREKKFMRYQERLLGMHDFMLLVDTAFSFLSFKPRREDLVTIFKNMDTNHTGFISYSKFFDFVSNHMTGRQPTTSHRKNTTTTSPGDSNLASSNVVSTDGGDQEQRRTRQLSTVTSTFFRV